MKSIADPVATALAPSARSSAGGATDRIVETLREAIVTLELPPGIVLDKATLTTRFGVSRFPVAEALNRLKAEGLVDIRPQSGSTVSLIRLADVRENMFLRRALEAETAALLAERERCRVDRRTAHGTCATRMRRSKPTIVRAFTGSTCPSTIC